MLAATITLGVGAVLLARVPQSGDGVEFVRLAELGGVPHAPGFPLAGWLHRLFALVPIGPSTARVAAVSLIGHALLAASTVAAARLLGCRALLAAAVGILVTAFPPLLYLGVQPEAFGLAHGLIGATLALGLWAAARPEPTPALALALGACFGAALAQHPITLSAAPAVAVPMWRWARRGAGTPRLAALCGAATLLVTGGLYLSLPALRTEAVWPDWGHLESLGDIIRHGLRKEFGVLDLSATAGDAHSGLVVTCIYLLVSWLFLPVLVVKARGFPPGGGALLGGSVALGALLLSRVEISGHVYPAVGIVERFAGPAVIPLGLLVGLGAERLAERWPRAVPAVTLAVASWTLAFGVGHSNAAADDTFAVFERELGRSLPAEAFYVGGSTAEIFGGVPTPAGRRYPLVGAYPWYWPEVAHELEPRLRTLELPSQSAGRLLPVLGRRGLLVASTDASIVERAGYEPRLRGLFYLGGPSLGDDVGAQVDGAARLCPAARTLPSLPYMGHLLSRQPQLLFARAFWEAAARLRERGAETEAQAFQRVADAIAEGRPITPSDCAALGDPATRPAEGPPR